MGSVIQVQFRDYLTPKQVLEYLTDMIDKEEVRIMGMVIIDNEGSSYTVAAGPCTEVEVAGMGGKLITYSSIGGDTEGI